MLEAVLIDLDNTMVLYDEAIYFERYFDKLCPCFSDLLSCDELFDRVVRITLALRENTGVTSNLEFFMDRFCSEGNGDRVEMWRRFMTFYEEEFHTIELDVSVPPGLNDVLHLLGKTELKLVLASNPIFPRIAQEKRLAWAGIDPDCFQLFTHIENMSFVKPNPAYFRQVCDMIDVPPEACLMVGNDRIADMAAGQAGIKTYLTTDADDFRYRSLSLADNESGQAEDVRGVDFIGPFSGVPEAVRKLQGVSGDDVAKDLSDIGALRVE